MSEIPEVVEMLDRIKLIHSKKNEDYTSVNPFDNFQRSAMVSEWFNNRYDKVFVTLISTKLARLATLLNSTKAPNNESVEDSFLDLATYCILWSAFNKRHPEHQTIQHETGASKGHIVPTPGCDCYLCRLHRNDIGNI